tara:strand:+ start:257 stop:427 length:171 start_codon:yes stop_codon:yes gene_type:complete
MQQEDLLVHVILLELYFQLVQEQLTQEMVEMPKVLVQLRLTHLVQLIMMVLLVVQV